MPQALKALGTLVLFINISVPAIAGVSSQATSCASKGVWTESALENTRSLLNIVQKLKDNPKCSAFKQEEIIKRLQEADQTLNLENLGHTRSERIVQLPREIDSLVNTAAEPKLREPIVKLLANRTLESAAQAVELSNTVQLPTALSFKVQMLTTLGQRAQRVASVGATILDTVFSSSNDLDECLMGTDAGLSLVSSAIHLAGSFVSSGQGVSNKFASSVGKLLQMVRDQKFTRTKNTLLKQEFWTSLSCLLETVTESYCAARDAKIIFQKGMEELEDTQVTASDGKTYNVFDTPLGGYRLLVRELPIISKWIQNIQIGVPHNIETDAQFRNQNMDVVHNFFKSVNVLKADFNQQSKTFNSLGSGKLEFKRSFLFGLLEMLVKNLSGGRVDTNFYEQTIPGPVMPYHLIGLTGIPAECLPPKTAVPLPWQQCVQVSNGGKFLPAFDNPDALINTMRERLWALTDQAQMKATSYYRTWVVVDTTNTVAEALTGPNMTVYQGLHHIVKYLDTLDRKVVRLKGDPIIRQVLGDTRGKVKAVLEAFARFRAAQVGGNDASRRLDAAAKDIVDAVFNNFNVLLQRDGFLTTRLSTLIYYDLSLMIRNQAASDKEGGLSYYEKLLFRVAERSMLDQMIQIHGLNPANVLQDIETALMVNANNLTATESFLRDSLYNMLEEVDAIGSGQGNSQWALKAKAYQRLFKDTYGSTYAIRDNPFSMTLAYASNLISPALAPVPLVTRYFLHRDLYYRRVSTHQTAAPEGAQEAFRHFKAKICVHTVSFTKRNRDMF
ncbi:MAG TPA: hypothetical protein VFV50_10900, partial [Bdellovibrionales bacterium]|nr:hypothetical protein [Bdellovibrionales bacterium]